MFVIRGEVAALKPPVELYLEQDGHTIYLDTKNSHILSIDQTGRIKLWEGVDRDDGFALDDKGRVVVK